MNPNLHEAGIELNFFSQKLYYVQEPTNILVWQNSNDIEAK
jgi:hypothetical protein